MKNVLIVFAIFLVVLSVPSSAETQAEAAKRCAPIQSQIDSINRRLRSGYKGKEGERLKDRLRALKRKLHVCKEQQPD